MSHKLSIVLVVSFAGIATAPPYPAPTASEIAACTPDALRFCLNAIPDHAKVFYCLRANKSRLSAGCRAVFISHGY